MHDDTLWKVYETALLSFAGSARIAVDLARPLSAPERASLAALGLGAHFAVITAFNPGGRNLSGARNRWRQLSLRAALTLRRARFVAASGESPDGSHRERGVAVAMSRGDAAAMARRFGQLAIYWFDGESFWIDGVLAPRAPKRLPA